VKNPVGRRRVDKSGFTEGRVIAAEVRRASWRGIGANVEVEDSSRGTRGQLVGRTVEVQVDEFLEILQRVRDSRHERGELSFVGITPRDKLECQNHQN